MNIKKNFLKNKKNNYINWRFSSLCSIIFLFLIILIFRIIFLQIINSKKLIYEGDRRTLRIQSTNDTRGIIKDSLGNPLALTVLMNAICVDPTMISDIQNIENNIRWKALSKVLSIPLHKIISRINSNKNKKFVYLARQITLEKGEYIKSLQIHGVFLQKESKRYYPLGKSIAQLIGINNIDGEGLEGIEKSFNFSLNGSLGTKKIRKDNKGRIIEKEHLTNNIHARNLFLSINKNLQNIVYQKINDAVIQNHANSGIGILVNVKNSEILAMANSSAYNPNCIKNIKQYNLRNQAITDVFEPGSTVKPIVIIKALTNGIIQENSMINTKPYFINKYQIQDVSYHSQLDVTGILQKSSNIGVSKIALCIPSDELIDTYIKFGLGQPTNLGLIGERKGFFPKKKKLSSLEKATFSFGYGFMITPLQLARLYTIIGNYGIYHPLSILKKNYLLYEKRIFPKKYVSIVLNMMEKTTQPREGGSLAAIKGYRVAVKTGTAKKVGKTGVYIKKYVSYTAGIAPVSNPQFALIIIIDDPKSGKYYGGSIAAPVFSKTMQLILKTMNIKPDKIS